MAETSGDWKFFDNTKELLEYIATEYGNDALFGRKYFSDHISPIMPQRQKNLVNQAFNCGAVKILQNNVNSDRQTKETAVKQAVGKLIDTYASAKEAAELVVWEFTNAIGWGMDEPAGAPFSPLPPRTTPSAQQSVPSDAEQKAAESILASLHERFVLKAESAANQSINLAGIEWRVLDKQDGKLLLISAKIIKKCLYTVTVPNNKITWENCTLRKYLNGEFLNNKLYAIKSVIAETTNSNPDNPWYGTEGGNTTTDKVFLFSINELVKYFGDSRDLENKRKKDSTGNIRSDGTYLDDRYNSARIAKYRNVGASWWLRSPGYNSRNAASVYDDGTVHLYGYNASNASGGVRPALWLNLQSFNQNRREASIIRLHRVEPR